METDDKKVPRKLFDFCDGNPKLSNLQGRKKLTKRFLRAKAKDHLKEFFRLLLKSLDKNSIELSKVSAFASKIWNEMEIEGICYFKKMPNGKLRIFKKLYCCRTVKDWKECPEYFCPVWPCNGGSECPYEDEETLQNVDVKITFGDRKQEKQSDAHQEGSPE